MKIKQSVLFELEELKNHQTVECGGIIGISGDEIVDRVELDEVPAESAYEYVPNTTFLNKKLAQWSYRQIGFAGVFHTHLFNIRSFSEKDKIYAEKILCSMENAERLYFPVYVLPCGELICYVGEKTGEGVTITHEDIEVIL